MSISSYIYYCPCCGVKLSSNSVYKISAGDFKSLHCAFCGNNSVRKIKELPTENFVAYQKETEHQDKPNGGSSLYYRIYVDKPTSDDVEPYTAECNDIIRTLNMTFAEGEIFKAVWRAAASRQGNGKPGNSYLYNANKIAFFAEDMQKKGEEE